MKKKYVIQLTGSEREALNMYVSKGENKAYKIKHAHILLKADKNGPGWTDKQIAEAFSCHYQTVYNVRRRFLESGLSGALDRRQRKTPPCPQKLDGEAEARLIALSCSEPPQGYSRWSLRLLASELVRLEIVERFVQKQCGRRSKKRTKATLCETMGDPTN